MQDKRHILILAVACFAIGGCGSPEQSQFLDWQPATPSQPEPPPPDALRSRYLQARPQSLYAAPDRLEVLFFDDAGYSFVKTGDLRRGAQDVTWMGKLEDAPDGAGYLSLLARPGLVVGHARVREKSFRIVTVAKDVVRVEEFVEPPSTCDYEQPPFELGPGELLPARIDVLVAYTPDARSAAGGTACIEAQIELVIDETNEILDQSDIAPNLRLVHTMEVDFDESNHATMADHRLWLKDAMEDPDHVVSQTRDEYKADIVSLWVKEGHDWCGQSRGIGVDESAAGHVVDMDCQNTWAFAHETGHLMGALHDVYRDPSTSPYAFGHGFILYEGLDPGSWARTIMAYNDFCEEEGATCPVLPVFSNPDITIFGRSLGTAEEADAAHVWDLRGFTVSQFR